VDVAAPDLQADAGDCDESLEFFDEVFRFENVVVSHYTVFFCRAHYVARWQSMMSHAPMIHLSLAVSDPRRAALFRDDISGRGLN
jgi:hypothetical protein